MPVACIVVGLVLAVWFGGIGVDSFLDYRAFPAAPTRVTVAQLAAMKAMPRGTWVTLSDAQPDCVHGYARPNDPAYVIVGDGKTAASVIVALSLPRLGEPPPCSSLAERELSGVPSLRATVEGAPGRGLPHELAWPGVDWQKWPQQQAVFLWTWSGPSDSRTGIWLGVGLGLLGVWLTWYGVRALLPKPPDVCVVDPTQFPATVQLARRVGPQLPASVLWLPVLRAEAVKARGIATRVTIYELETPPNAAPLAARTSRTLSAHTGPGIAGLIFRSAKRDAVAAARPAGSDTIVILRSDLAQLDLSPEARSALRARQLRALTS